jgi:transcriptional regulator with GAF, ATPase, and Fis domain
VRVYWTLGALTATLGTAIFNGFKERQATVSVTAAAGARSQLAIALTKAGEPLLVALSNVTSAKTPQDKRAKLDVLIHLAVDLAQEACGRDATVRGTTRSAYYALVEDRLERQCVAGRQGNTTPRKTFQAGHSAHDDEIIRLARSEDVLVVEDLENYPPPRFADNKGRSYKSFISVPVRAGDESYGLLTVDSDQAHSLTEVDRGYMILLAAVVAAGLAHQRDSSTVEGTGPRPPQPRPGGGDDEKGDRLGSEVSTP